MTTCALRVSLNLSGAGAGAVEGSVSKREEEREPSSLLLLFLRLFGDFQMVSKLLGELLVGAVAVVVFLVIAALPTRSLSVLGPSNDSGR